jgi:DNA helicase HerA-like ATPase
VLLSGPSGSGKSTLVLAFLEALSERAVQFVLVDPEGDYDQIETAVRLGTADRAPSIDEVDAAMAEPTRNVVVNLLGEAVADRPGRADALLARIQGLRGRSGRPHWLIFDEAHHLLPAAWHPVPGAAPGDVEGFFGVTVHPDRLARTFLEAIDVLVVVGADPGDVVGAFAGAAGLDVPEGVPTSLEADEALFWRTGRGSGQPRVLAFRPIEPRGERRRHRRKYAEGALTEDRSFWFRGPEDRLNLRAQNLEMFLQIGDGVDDETWLHHQRQGDYSRWIRDIIKDEDLAAEVAAVEEDRSASPKEARQRIRAAVEQRYAAPA